MHCDLSIVLVNWNALSLTSSALASIREKTDGIDYEVFVVDNGSTNDDSVKTLPANFPWITLIANSENLGFTKANNQAIRRANGRYVVLLNNDTIQTENALGESVRYMDNHPDLGALGIKHLNNDAEHTPQPSYFSFPRPYRESLGMLGISMHSDDTSMSTISLKETDVDWVCGSFLMMRRACLESVGMLDERFFIYDEDVDWCRRARKSGWGVRFWPGASMIHWGAASNPFMKDKTFVMFRSHLTYICKHHSLLAASFYYTAMSVRLTLATLKQTVGLFTGRVAWETVVDRVRRQRQFMSLSSSRKGC